MESNKLAVHSGNHLSNVKAAKDPEIFRFEAKNEVYLVGRVSSLPQERELPSGDRVVEFRMVIDRKIPRSRSTRAPMAPGSPSKSDAVQQEKTARREVDTLDLAVWSSPIRKKALGLKVDSWVTVTGAVRRRFWQAPSGLASRWQVEVHSLSRLK